MASKLNTSVTNQRKVSPPEPLRERHEYRRLSNITIERQYLTPSPLARKFTDMKPEADPDIIRRETPLFAPGNGKAPGSKRTLRLRKPPYD